MGKIGIIDDFFELGGDSLKAMTLSGKIHRQFDVEIQLTDFFGHPTIKDLAAFIDASTKNEFRSIPKAPKKDHYLLSAAQKRLFFIQHMAPEATAYNLPQVLMLPGVPDKDQLERIFNTLIERHESFRTSFELTDEGPVQIIHDPERIRFSIHYPDYTINPNDFNTELLRFVVPFDLSVAPLLRAAVIKTTENTWMLFTDMHHIISDGVSMTRLETEFTDLAAGRTLPPLPIQYRDFSEWQNSDAQQQKKTEKAQYWLNQFGDSVPTLELPYDFPRPPVTRFEGNTTRFGLEKEIVDRLKEIGAPSDATLYMVLMAIHFIFLSKLSGQEDIVVGIPVAGRNHPDLQPIIGMFVNTLAIRNYPVAEQTFLSFLEEVKTSALRAYENQDYPFEELVEKLTLERNTARNPVFDVVFNMLNQAEFKGELPSDHGYVHTPGVSKYDLTMYFVELEGGRGLIFNVEYGSNLFKPETINRFIGYYKHIVSQVMAQPDIELKAIDILGEEERHRIVSAFSQSGETFAIDKTLHGLFEEQAARTPDNIAVVGNFYQGAFLKNRPLDPQKTFCFLTYRQLNEQSEHLACVLRDKGINFDAIVAIKIRRSIEMIIGILGILKSGAAYLPINPNQPDARTQYMLADSGAKLLITGEGDRLEISVGADPRVCPRVSFEREMGAHMGAPLQLNKNSHIAYVIYTSGSTGNPKGVPIGHSSITALMRWARKELGLTKEDRVIQNLSFYFDWSVEEIFLPLVTGASLCIVPEEWIMQPESLIDLFHRYDITALNMGPTQLSFLLGAGKKLSTLKYLYMGVEKLNVELLERILEAVNETCRICFMYGPTEATVLCTKFEIDRSRFNIYKQQFASLPIGKPVVNNALYIMNKQLQVCPIGVTGEIYIAGDGLSGGYLNNPELTNETFIIINSPSINTQTKSFCPAFYKKRAAG
ncbi:MAG: condensation domain-containing protein, partial [Candidatus Omnitrophota bacterium]